MEELIKKLELNNNVKKLTYEKSTGLWCIQYNNGYNPDAESDNDYGGSKRKSRRRLIGKRKKRQTKKKRVIRRRTRKQINSRRTRKQIRRRS